MVIMNKLADGSTECFNTENYLINTKSDMLHPLILSVSVYDNGKRIGFFKRKHAFWYKHFKFHSPEVQLQIKNLRENQAKENNKADSK